MLIQRVLLVAALCLLSHAVSGDTKPSQFTRFRPISQPEYEAILRLTDGKPVVSEGRLIEGGLAALAGLASSWVTSLRFPDIFGTLESEQKSANASYPLCVIKTDEIPAKDQHPEHHNHIRSSDDSHESLEANYEHYFQHHDAADHSSEYVHHEHHDAVEMTWHKNQPAPVVNCIVVLKEDEHHDHTTAKRPKRPRKKHRVHSWSPSPSPVFYPYSMAPIPYAVHPPPGSYNTRWYWQSPYYNPYYSDPTAYTGIYPAAYPDIYATNSPGAYPGPFPVPYPVNSVSSPTGNNPNPYYNPYPGTYSNPSSSAHTSHSYNTQPSSIASSYPNMEISVIEQVLPPPSITNSNFIHNMQPSEEGGALVPQPEPQANLPTKINERVSDSHIAPVKSMKIGSRKVKTRPKNEMTVAQTPTTKAINTPTHTKVKRDEAGTQSHSYAKIASFSESGYQPTLYPQNSYQSNYPKVSYTHALPYSAPVYVRNGIEQPSAGTKIKRYYANEADSEEDDNSTEFIEARKIKRLSLN